MQLGPGDKSGCDWKRVSDRAIQCERCGRVYIARQLATGEILPFKPELFKPCAASQDGTVRKFRRYVSAVSRWVAAGRPERSQAEMDRLFGVCQRCPHFNRATSACRVCGCKLSRTEKALKNKLRMATETCPHGRWNDAPPPRATLCTGVLDAMVRATVADNPGALVVYTAICGKIADTLHAPLMSESPHGAIEWRCYTDRQDVKPVWPWKVIPIPLSGDGRLKARFLKTACDHGTEYSLWMDGNMELRTDPWEMVQRYLDHSDIATFDNTIRDCVLDEYKLLERMGRKGNFKDDAEVMRSQVFRYLDEGLPRHGGMQMTGMVLRRHTEPIQRLCEMWWGEITTGSIRDQLSLPYCLWKTGITPAKFDGTAMRSDWHTYYFHRGKKAGEPKR